jgi:hypothetical protein
LYVLYRRLQTYATINRQISRLNCIDASATMYLAAASQA